MKKRNFRVLLTVGSLVSALQCATGEAMPYIMSIDPFYAGVEYKLTKVDPLGAWNRVFNNTWPGPAVFFGGRFPTRCAWPFTFGLEFGYGWTVNKGKSTLIPPNGSFQGVPNDSGLLVPLDISGKVRFKSGYMDLISYLHIPFFPCVYPQLMFTFGVASSKPMMEIAVVPLLTNNITTQLTNLRGVTRSTLRAGMGFQGMFWDYWGFRAMFRWEGYSRLRANKKQTLTASNPHIFDDAYSFSLGVFCTFQAF